MTGSIVTFDDAIPFMPIESIVAQIEPIQNLHGYDSPWPAGGGKNKLNNTATTTTSNGVTFTVNADGTVTANGTATGTAVLRINQTFDIAEDIILNGCPSGGQITTGYSMIAANATGMNIGSNVDTGNGAVISASVVPSIAQIQIIVRNGTTVNNLVLKPMIRLASITDGTYAPYSNECPISGWTGMNGQRTGVNVWDEEWEVGAYNGTTGAKVRSNSSIRSKNFIPVKPDTQYFAYYGKTGDSLYALFYDVNKEYINLNNQAVNVTNMVFTTPSNAHYMNFRTFASGVTTTTYEDNITIAYPSTNTSYHAYSGESLSVSWQDTAGTVYGGNITINDDGSGELVVEYADVDLGTLNYNYQSKNSRFVSRTGLPNAKYAADDNTKFNGDCSALPIITANQTTGESGLPYGVALGSSDSLLRIRYSSLSDAAAFKTAVTGQTLVYELATPQTYHFDNLEQLTTLIGTNNVWVDTGDVSVTYQSTTSHSEYIVGMIGRAIEVFDENTELPENTSDVLENTIDVFDEHEVEKIDNPLLKNTIELYDPKEIDESEKPEDTFNDTVDIFD